MGGAGSGRRPVKLSVWQCRRLALAELCDGGRRARQPFGELEWRCAGELRGRLSYTIEPAASGEALLYRYWPSGEGSPSQGRIELVSSAGRRTTARCPSCGRTVRDLYAPPGRQVFACRCCSDVVYRSSDAAAELDELLALAGPVLGELARLPAAGLPNPRRPRRARLPEAVAAQLAGELPLAPEEERLWTLRLRRYGLSYRRIARQLERSKSSVARTCRAGKAGIDVVALIGECRERAAALPPLPEEDEHPDPQALARFLAALLKRSRAHELAGRRRERPQEERLLLPPDAGGGRLP